MDVLLAAAGNRFRRDDGVGPEVLDRLRGPLEESVRFLELGGDPLAGLTAWSPDDRIVLVDAVRSGVAPGTLHRLDGHRRVVFAGSFPLSSHGFGPAELIELAKHTGRLPGRLIIYGVEGSDFGMGEGLSEPVARAVEAAAEQVRSELERLLVR